MSGPAARCPNCSAPIRFRWSAAVQTVCEHCRSVVVRHDLDLLARGEASEPPPDSSPIQLGTEGVLDGRAFTVVGRIAYDYEDGGWNEWHLGFADGRSGWLSDAQLEYAASSLVPADGPLPPADDVHVGRRLAWKDRELQITALTKARYRGVDGDLPFEYWGREWVLFADLRGYNGEFATIDYSGQAPQLYVGRFVAFDELSLRNLRAFDRW